MSMASILTSALTELFTDACESSVFTSSWGATVSCRVYVDKGVQLQPGGFEAQAWGQVTTLEYLLHVVGKEADRGETFTVGSTVYRVVAVVANDGYVVKVEVK